MLGISLVCPLEILLALSLSTAGGPSGVAPILDASTPAGIATATQAQHERHWTIAPYLWMYGLDGEVGVLGQTSEVDASFDDIVENLDFALQGHVEYWHGTVGYFFDGQYGELSSDGSAGPIGLEVKSEITIIELGVATRVVDRPLDPDGGRRLKVDGLVGTRYYDLDLQVDPDPPVFATTEDGEAWLDAFFGARCEWDFARKFSLSARGDIGGFGLGGSSDLAWQAQALVGWRLSKVTTIAAGYRVLDVDYDNGGFLFDTTLSGPLLGVVFQF